MLMYSFAWTTESEDEDEDSEAESVESDLSQPESVAPSGLLMALPIELLSEVFTLCLITSKFKGWTTLLLLSKACHAELLYNPMVLRRTLPLVYGGVFPTLSKLIYCRTRIRSDRQQTLCRIIDGVASGIRYDAKDVHAQIKRLSFFPVHLDLKELPNLAMMKLAADISANTSYIVNSITFGYLTDHMRSIRNTRNVEYQRYKVSILHIIKAYRPTWFCKDFLSQIHKLGDEPFFDEVATVGQFTQMEIQDVKRGDRNRYRFD